MKTALDNHKSKVKLLRRVNTHEACEILKLKRWQFAYLLKLLKLSWNSDDARLLIATHAQSLNSDGCMFACRGG
jgi:hypothetical protein